MKKNAIAINDKLLFGSKIIAGQREITSNGLSSIFDNSFVSQRSLFSESSRICIKNYFDGVSKLSPVDLNEKVADNIIIVNNTLSLSNDVSCRIRLARIEAELAVTEISRICLFTAKTGRHFFFQ